jgi:septation ring formation regulator EzrA
MITKRELRDIINKLEYISKKLKELSNYNEIDYEKALELRAQQQDIYNKWKFYKGLQLELSKPKSR